MTMAWGLGLLTLAFGALAAGCGGEVKSSGASGEGGDTGTGGFPGCENGCVCPHSECITGDALPGPCSPCATQVCELDPFCCGAEGGFWDEGCATHAVNTAACGCPTPAD